MKRFNAILLLIGLIAAAAACGRRPAESGTAAAPVQNGPAETALPQAAAYHDVFDPETDFDNRFGRTFVSVTETEKAIYYLPSHGGYIYYFDKESGESGVLCAKPECEHDSKPADRDCQGYIGAQLATLNHRGGKLYYMGSAPLSESRIGAAVFCMAEDGSGREKLFPMDCEPIYGPQRLDLHRGKFYARSMSEKIEDGVPKQFRSVSSWDLETGEFKSIYEGAGASTVIPTLFFFGRYVYICVSWKPGFDTETGGEGARNGSVTELYRWDTEEEKLETIARTEQDFELGWMPSIWVDSEERIYIVPKTASIGNGQKAAVYMLRDGSLTESFDFGMDGSMDVLDGGVILYDFDREKETMAVHIRDFGGAAVFDGELDMRFLRGIAAGAEFKSFYAAAGDLNTVYFSMILKADDGMGDKSVLLRCDLSGGEPVPAVLCVGNWE